LTDSLDRENGWGHRIGRSRPRTDPSRPSTRSW